MNIYVVQNLKGQYFRNVGRDGGGKSWRDKLEDAKFYTKLGQARARVTFWYKHAPEFGCPKIIQFSLDDSNKTVIDMEQETKKAMARIEKKELQYNLRQLTYNLQKSLGDKATLVEKIEKLNKQLAALAK